MDNVCIAAARAIDRNYSDVLAVGIRNLLHGSGEGFRRIITAVIDAEADSIFLDLAEEESFRKFAIVYLKNKAHHDVAEHFRKLFERNACKDLLEALGAISKHAKDVPASNGKNCVVVDDSKMILSVYRTTLHSMGWNVELFELPAAAVERLKTGTCPDLLITDLNMPVMTGIELAAAVRIVHPSGKLPILMVTTQHESQDSDAATKAGVDMVTHKPFTAESLGKAIDSVMATRKIG